MVHVVLNNWQCTDHFAMCKTDEVDKAENAVSSISVVVIVVVLSYYGECLQDTVRQVIQNV